MCAAHQDPGAAVGGADLEHKDLNAVQREKFLPGNLLFFVEHSVSLAQVDTDVFPDISLYDTGDDIFLFINVIIVNNAALFFPDLLHDHVLGDLGGDPAEAAAVDIHTDYVADIHGRINLHSVLIGDVLKVVHDIFRRFDNLLLRIAGVVKGITVNFHFDVLRLAEMALAGGHQRILDRFKKRSAAYIFFLFQGEYRLFQLTVHTVSFCSKAVIYIFRSFTGLLIEGGHPPHLTNTSVLPPPAQGGNNSKIKGKFYRGDRFAVKRHPDPPVRLYSRSVLPLSGSLRCVLRLRRVCRFLIRFSHGYFGHGCLGFFLSLSFPFPLPGNRRIRQDHNLSAIEFHEFSAQILLTCFRMRLIEMDLHVLADTLAQVAVLCQGPAQPGAGHDKCIGVPDEIGLVQFIRQEAADSLTIIDGHTPVFIDVDIQVILLTFPYIFNIVDPDSKLLRDRGGDGLCPLLILLPSGFTGLFFFHMILSDSFFRFLFLFLFTIFSRLFPAIFSRRTFFLRIFFPQNFFPANLFPRRTYFLKIFPAEPGDTVSGVPSAPHRYHTSGNQGGKKAAKNQETKNLKQ